MDHKCKTLRDWNASSDEYHRNIVVTTDAYWGDDNPDGHWNLVDYDDTAVHNINFCPFCGRNLSGKVQKAEDRLELERVANEEEDGKRVRKIQLEYLLSHPEITAQWLMLDGYRKTSEDIQKELDREKEEA